MTGQSTKPPAEISITHADVDPDIVVRPVNKGAFVWPPAPPGIIVPPTAPIHTKPSSRFARLIHSIETTLLGRNALSFARQAKLDRWQPDKDAAYCWRCGGSIGEFESDGEGCSSCRNTKLQWDQAVRLGVYGGLLRDGVLDLKFHRWRTSGREIGQQLGSSVSARMQRAQILPHEVLVVPVPMSARRRIRRGVDHTRVLGEGVSSEIGCQMIRLLHARHRPEQIGLSMTARDRNIKGAFHCRRNGFKQISKDCRVILVIDDVRTTGATMTAAIKAIKQGLRKEKNGPEMDAKPKFWAVTPGVAGPDARDRQILKK
jgi:predicted amidophosphoribosyltransferase